MLYFQKLKILCCHSFFFCASMCGFCTWEELRPCVEEQLVLPELLFGIGVVGWYNCCFGWFHKMTLFRRQTKTPLDAIEKPYETSDLSQRGTPDSRAGKFPDLVRVLKFVLQG